jgi:hypothetical protein
MAPHLTSAEIDQVRSWVGQGKAPVEVHRRLKAQRDRVGKDTPTLWNVRRIIKGQTYRQGGTEARGRKRKATRRSVVAMDKARKTLIREAKGEKEVTWPDVVKKARVKKVHPSTAKRAFQREGGKYAKVAWRPAREKPQREKWHLKERVKICKDMAARPASFYTSGVDLIMDNKKWAIPTTARGKTHLKMLKVRGHLRTPKEGLAPGYTKPNNKKNRINPGASVNVLAGIIDCKLRLWVYLPKKWNGATAAEQYRGPIAAALKKHRGNKRRFVIIEDNDPTGYKSNVAKAVKEDLHIEPMEWPAYSPDLNPLDYFLWNEVERRMMRSRVARVETAPEYKARLRRTAMSIPHEVIKKAVARMKTRAQAIVDEKGHNIARD